MENALAWLNQVPELDPLLPVLNRSKPTTSTAEIDFKTIRQTAMTSRSHLNQVVLDTATWEKSVAFHLEQAKMDNGSLAIPYELYGVSHWYEPDFLVRLVDGTTVVFEIKGLEDEQDRAKHEAAKRWCAAMTNWGQMGQWVFHVCKDPAYVASGLRACLVGG